MLTRTVDGKQRLIPVLLGDVEIPPFLASRLWIDFRGADGPVYEERLRDLAAGLQGVAAQRPTAGSALEPPPGTGYRPAGPLRCTLQVGRTRRFSSDVAALSGRSGESDDSHLNRWLGQLVKLAATSPISSG